MAHWDSSEIEDPDAVEQMIAAQVGDMAAGLACYWAVERSLDQVFLGACDLSDIDWRHRRGEVGFVLAGAAWGQGFGLEAMRAVVDHAAALGLKRLWARSHAGNERSERLLEATRLRGGRLPARPHPARRRAARLQDLRPAALTRTPVTKTDLASCPC